TDRFLFADPRSLSQLIASFIASESLGIPHTPLFAFPYVLPGRCPPSCIPAGTLRPVILFARGKPRAGTASCPVSIFFLSQHVKERFARHLLPGPGSPWTRPSRLAGPCGPQSWRPITFEGLPYKNLYGGAFCPDLWM